MKKIIMITLLLFSYGVKAEIKSYPKQVVEVMVSKDTVGFDKKVIKVDNVVYSISKDKVVTQVMTDDSKDFFLLGILTGILFGILVLLIYYITKS